MISNTVGSTLDGQVMLFRSDELMNIPKTLIFVEIECRVLITRHSTGTVSSVDSSPSLFALSVEQRRFGLRFAHGALYQSRHNKENARVAFAAFPTNTTSPNPYESKLCVAL